MLINSDSQLRAYIPNAFATAPGEPSLFEKLSTFLATAEQWFTHLFAPEDMLEEIKSLAAPVIVAHAYLLAVPALNIVLTPNGFATVGNNDVVAASARRTEALVEGLSAQRDEAIAALLAMLPKYPKWLESKQAAWFAGTLFPNIHVIREIGIYKNIWDEYLAKRDIIASMEFSLANRYFSPELMYALRKENAAGTISAQRAFIVHVIQRNIIRSLCSDIPENEQQIIDAVQFIRTHPDSFPEWHVSETAKLFTPPVFRNKKSSTAYFF